MKAITYSEFGLSTEVLKLRTIPTVGKGEVLVSLNSLDLIHQTLSQEPESTWHCQTQFDKLFQILMALGLSSSR